MARSAKRLIITAFTSVLVAGAMVAVAPAAQAKDLTLCGIEVDLPLVDLKAKSKLCDLIIGD